MEVDVIADPWLKVMSVLVLPLSTTLPALSSWLVLKSPSATRILTTDVPVNVAPELMLVDPVNIAAVPLDPTKAPEEMPRID